MIASDIYIYIYYIYIYYIYYKIYILYIYIICIYCTYILYVYIICIHIYYNFAYMYINVYEFNFDVYDYNLDLTSQMSGRRSISIMNLSVSNIFTERTYIYTVAQAILPTAAFETLSSDIAQRFQRKE